MASVDADLGEYNKDPRVPCKYGAKCYQKNSSHLTKYKHPPKNNKRKNNVKDESSKKPKLNEVSMEKKELKNSYVEEQESVSEEIKQETSKKECISDSESDLEQGEESVSKEVKEETSKKEYISDSDSDVDQSKSRLAKKPTQESTTQEPESKTVVFDPKKILKEKFLVDMPADFYAFWEFCKEMKVNNPCDAFKDVGLKLVGAYDVLAGNFNHVKKSPEDYLRHWRYYYDPPEMQTVLKGDDSTGYHIGYFFDSPDEPPALLVSNNGIKDGILNKMGDNIFAAVSFYLEELKKVGDPFKKMRVGKLLTSVRNRADKLKLDMSTHSIKIKKRETKVVTKTSNKVGLVVPYNRKTELGYRDLAVSDKELMMLLNRLEKASPEQKSKCLSDLQTTFTNANIALDECDFGTGIKLGWELLYHGVDSLNSTILQFLTNSYKLLKKDSFAKIAEAHLANRRKGCDLSVL